MFCPICERDRWAEICIGCNTNIHKYYDDPRYKEEVDKEKINKLSSTKGKKKNE